MLLYSMRTADTIFSILTALFGSSAIFAETQ